MMCFDIIKVHFDRDAKFMCTIENCDIVLLEKYSLLQESLKGLFFKPLTQFLRRNSLVILKRQLL